MQKSNLIALITGGIVFLSSAVPAFAHGNGNTTPGTGVYVDRIGSVTSHYLVISDTWFINAVSSPAGGHGILRSADSSVCQKYKEKDGQMIFSYCNR